MFAAPFPTGRDAVERVSGMVVHELPFAFAGLHLWWAVDKLLRVTGVRNELCSEVESTCVPKDRASPLAAYAEITRVIAVLFGARHHSCWCTFEQGVTRRSWQTAFEPEVHQLVQRRGNHLLPADILLLQPTTGVTVSRAAGRTLQRV